MVIVIDLPSLLVLVLKSASDTGVPAAAGEVEADALFVHVVPPLGLVYVPAPPPAARYLSRMSPSPEKARAWKPLDGIEPAKVTLVRLVQDLNAPLPMLVTLAGMVTLVRLVQPVKVESPMLVTLLDMVTLARLVQLPKR